MRCGPELMSWNDRCFPNAVVDTLLFLFCIDAVSKLDIVMRCLCASGTSFSLGSSGGTGMVFVLKSTVLLCLLGVVSRPGITKSGVAISHKLSSDTIEEVADLSRL